MPVFCFGVKRAVEMTEEALKNTNNHIACCGSLIHNPQEIDRLKNLGLRTVKTVDEIPEGGTMIIRSHGVTLELIKKAKERRLKIIDATCPFVKNAQNVAEEFHEKGYTVVICGDPNHIEVIGINSRTGNNALVVQDAKEIDNFGKIGRAGVLCQTTQKFNLLKGVVEKLLEKSKLIDIRNTICLDSSTKQNELKELAKEVDLMIIIGGKESSNTTKLAELSLQAGAKTFHVESYEEINEESSVELVQPNFKYEKKAK